MTDIYPTNWGRVYKAKLTICLTILFRSAVGGNGNPQFAEPTNSSTICQLSESHLQETTVIQNLFGNAYQNRTVLVTGHTGFKGSWLAIWLEAMGANVVGFSLPDPPTTPSNFAVTGLEERIVDVRGDVRNLSTFVDLVKTHRPSLIFHLAAQPIVFRSVREPVETFGTNAMGTVNVLEAVRKTPGVEALVSITTDKVYADQEWLWGYREHERLGGHDPYSASKAMAELAIDAYRDSYFAPATYEQHGVAVASTRAGNVIGGGDFAAHRLVPDCMRALMANKPIEVRNPANVRPWQLVLEPLSGYLWLGARLLAEGPAYNGAWNFGPKERRGITAGELVETIIEYWGEGTWIRTNPELANVETGHLRLSWEKAAAHLGWQPVYTWKEAVREVVSWFRAFSAGQEMYGICRDHISAYVRQANHLGLPWAGP